MVDLAKKPSRQSNVESQMHVAMSGPQMSKGSEQMMA
jgi:hypothetical protein